MNNNENDSNDLGFWQIPDTNKTGSHNLGLWQQLQNKGFQQQEFKQDVFEEGIRGYFWGKTEESFTHGVLEDSTESKKARIDYLNRESQNLPVDYHTQFTSLDNQSDYETI